VIPKRILPSEDTMADLASSIDYQLALLLCQRHSGIVRLSVDGNVTNGAGQLLVPKCPTDHLQIRAIHLARAAGIPGESLKPHRELLITQGQVTLAPDSLVANAGAFKGQLADTRLALWIERSAARLRHPEESNPPQHVIAFLSGLAGQIVQRLGQIEWFPGLETITTNRAWVELTLRKLKPRGHVPYGRSEPHAFLVDRFYQSALIIADPGGGKSTLMLWIAAGILAGAHPRFFLPLPVRLRTFATLGTLDQLTLVKFAIRQFAPLEDKQTGDIAERIFRASGAGRYVAAEGTPGPSALLLLDGLDEFPDISLLGEAP